MNLPAWRWKWAQWMLGHGPYRPFGPKAMDHRPGYPVPLPGQIPKKVKDWYYKTFAPEIAAMNKPPVPPIPPVTLKSVFKGIGGFTSYDPMAALKYKGLVDVVAVHMDAINDETGAPRATPEHVRELKAAGFRVVGWRSWDHLANWSPEEYGVEGIISQAEGPGQLNNALILRAGKLNYEHALVTNNFMAEGAFPKGFYALPEAYLNLNSEAEPGKVASGSKNLGATEGLISPVFGNYVSVDEGAIDVSLQHYVSLWGKTNFWLYLMETMGDGSIESQRDMAYLRSIR